MRTASSAAEKHCAGVVQQHPETRVTCTFNGAPIGGIRVSSKSGWFAARPSGTEEIYKIYAESFLSQAHLDQILGDAQTAVDRVLAKV